MFDGYSLTPACSPALLMYVIIQAYVTTMAATAITINNSVASIGDMALFDLNMFFVNASSPCCVGNLRIVYLNHMNWKSTLSCL